MKKEERNKPKCFSERLCDYWPLYEGEGHKLQVVDLGCFELQNQNLQLKSSKVLDLQVRHLFTTVVDCRLQTVFQLVKVVDCRFELPKLIFDMNLCNLKHKTQNKSHFKSQTSVPCQSNRTSNHQAFHRRIQACLYIFLYCILA